ncbi:hypothetical protein NZK35_07390 [Stieleria sp. ICT_E10.1]|uniref:hypothetical protein n=1 Tax=Stieleria sedimenti TaxID=2976331 RepID=UPI0021803044|nr:hypothetical protein [Stieleria sedimenti]MCS7466462.1 hypothetical protein [Stieleria sedimenti]
MNRRSVDWVGGTNLPIPPKRIRLGETSAELIMLFSRRRDLMYQVSVLVAVSMTLLRALSIRSPTKHLGVETQTLITLFLAGSALLFCLRFVQLHIGIVYHGMRFAIAEAQLLERDQVQQLEKSSKFNLMGVSVQIISFFAVVTGLASLVLVVQWEFNFTVALVFGTLVATALMTWTYLNHLRIAHTQSKNLRTLYEQTKPDELEDLRTHYIASLNESHLDMICITATAALQTFAVFSAIGFIETERTLNAAAAMLASLVLSLISVLLGVISVRIYKRLRNAVHVFCKKLSWYTQPAFERTVSDTFLGFAVTASFLAMSFMVAVDVGLQYLLGYDQASGEVVGLVAGIGLFVTVLVVDFCTQVPAEEDS